MTTMHDVPKWPLACASDQIPGALQAPKTTTQQTTLNGPLSEKPRDVS